VLDYSQASGSNVVHAHLTCPTTDGSPCVNSTLVPGAKNEIQQLEWDPSCSLAGSTTCQTIWYTGFSGLLGEVRFDPGTGNVLATEQFPVPAATSRDWPYTWQLRVDANNVYLSEFNDVDLVRFSKATQLFDEIPLPMTSSDIVMNSLAISNGRLYFTLAGGWANDAALGYVDVASWNAGTPQGVMYNDLSQLSGADTNVAQLAPGSFNGIAIDPSSGAIAVGDFGRKQILLLRP
jgi:hypothetical protein